MDQDVNLCGARIALNATKSLQTDLYVRNGKVFVGQSKVAKRYLDLSGFLILPGLVNAHDHLELNLLPRLGRGPYPNATAWAKDIYRPHQSPLKEHLKIPKRNRLLWGGIKNLLSGVTCVAHHNEGCPFLFQSDFPVRVLERSGWAHSLRFSPDWKQRFHRTPPGTPFIIHAAEGTDRESLAEIYQLHEQSALTPLTVLVHGVALGSKELELMEKSSSSLIICPTSNLFTLGRTVSRDVLRSRMRIALGTDSALTADGDLIDELRAASCLVSLSRLYEMVTTTAAGMLGLGSTAGRIQHGGSADLLVVADIGQTPAEALIDLRPEMVFVRGRLHLVSQKLASTIPLFDLPKYRTIEIHGRGRWLLPFNVPALKAQAESILSTPMRLAGKAVAV